ncbi:hypothetical protein [Saccharomonospora amisosensis]|uniref:hypothetical protein n=1 Tax=Saccharomonospora amisosensis TaxID=1128677 RepID=UPI001FB970ED|nr:hypothetical protein [Saccharomonospora amisosensis]
MFWVTFCAWSGDAEHRDNPVGSGDLDFGDEGLDECLAHRVGAEGDDLRDVVGDLRKRRWGELGRHVGELLGELVSACPELLGLGVESGQPASKHLLIERAVLERT